MKDRGLIALNVVLVVLLGVVTFSAVGVSGQPGRVQGEYTAVGGRIQGGNSNAIYVLDATNQELVALRWNETTKALEGIGYRNLAQDAQAAAGGAPR